MPIPDGAGEAHVECILGSQARRAQITLGFDVGAPPFTQDHANELVLFLQSGLVSITTTGCTWVGGYVLIGAGAGDLRYDVPSSGTIGSYSGAGSSPQVAALVRKNSLIGGRRNRGRCFIPGPPEGEISADGLLSTGYRGAVQAVFDAIYDEAPSLPMNVGDWVILHQEGVQTPTTISGFTAEGLVASQRRRVGR